MDIPALIAAREQLDSLAGYLLKAFMRDKVEGRAVSTFTLDAVANMAATMTKVVAILDGTLGANAPTPPSPSFPQPAPAQPPGPTADTLAKTLQDFTDQTEKWAQEVRADAARKFQEQYGASLQKMGPPK